jgi:hypothetical protein
VPESHTSTNEWQSFEARMRRRRGDRCLLRASAALDADVPDIAQQLFAEARALDPNHPDLQEVAERLLVVSQPVPPKGRRPIHNPTAAMALVLLVLAGLCGAGSTEAVGAKAVLKWVLAVVGL